MRFKPLDPEAVAAALRGDPDANGQPPERGVSDGSGNPCRCCLRFIDEGDPMLILAARPFGSMHPYAELGPVFLHADGCETWSGEGVPPVLTASPDYLMRGYDASERIVYGTGSIVPADDITIRADVLLSDERIAFVDIRSARNNCWQARVVRGWQSASGARGFRIRRVRLAHGST